MNNVVQPQNYRDLDEGDRFLLYNIPYRILAKLDRSFIMMSEWGFDIGEHSFAELAKLERQGDLKVVLRQAPTPGQAPTYHPPHLSPREERRRRIRRSAIRHALVYAHRDMGGTMLVQRKEQQKKGNNP
jgi:hypothetical protein